MEGLYGPPLSFWSWIKEKIMPHSYRTFDQEMLNVIKNLIPEKSSLVLDVGAGAGKYADLLGDYYTVDAIEVFAPYLNTFNLKNKYRTVYIAKAQDIPQEIYEEYDLVIMGDVLEHMTVEHASRILKHCENTTVLVAVPYEYEQEAMLGNKYEEHIQDDLTHEKVLERYPQLTLLFGSSDYGVYIQLPKAKRNIQQPIVTSPSTIKNPEYDPELHEAVVPKSVCIGTPLAWHLVFAAYARSLYTTGSKLTQMGIQHRLLHSDGALVAKNRNKIVAEFMNTTDDVLIFIDSDMEWDINVIQRILSSKKAVCGVPVRKKTFDVRWNFNALPGEVAMDGPLLEVRSVGTGILAIHRQVFKRMFAEYPHLKIGWTSEGKQPDYWKYMYNLFQVSMTEDQEELSEDISFCYRWRDIGGSVWIDTGSQVGHIGTHTFTGSMENLIIKKELPESS